MAFERSSRNGDLVVYAVFAGRKRSRRGRREEEKCLTEKKNVIVLTLVFLSVC